MNRAKWRKASFERLGLKLAEESGETTQVILNYIEHLDETGAVNSDEHYEARREMLLQIHEEAEHACHIANEITKRADRLRDKLYEDRYGKKG